MSTLPGSRRSPGAMTQAMQAVRVEQGPKVLRIGVLHDARIVEERVLRDAQSVTIGTSEKSTFTVSDASMPSRFVLFAHDRDGFALRFTDAMEGRVATPGGVFSLAQLRASGRAVRDGDVWTLRIDSRARGKVSVADVGFLFQFVTPPPARPRPQLPVAIRANPVKQQDWMYNACVAAFLALAFGGMSYVEYLYDPVVDDPVEVQASAVLQHLITPPSSPEPIRTDPAASTEPTPPTDHNAPPVNARNDSPRRQDHHGAPTPPAHHQADPGDVANVALHTADVTMHAFQQAQFNPLVAYVPGQPGDAIDHLAQGNTIDGTVAALSHDVGIGRDDMAGIHRNGLVATNDHPGDLRGHTQVVAPEVVAGRTENIIVHAPAGHVTSEPAIDPPVDGPDVDDVARVIRQNLGGIRWCYNEGIRNLPTLSGRVEVHFTLGSSGRIVGTPRVTGFETAPSVTACIAGRFRSMVFPPAPEGRPEYTFPFQFTPGG